jgi:CRISPR-associated protein (TIGR03986 family)
MITAPYNFVPLNETVVSPFWADFVSHDKPFRNAKSGTIEVSLTAESPIYVRNGGPRKFEEVVKNGRTEQKEIIDSEFNHLNGKYFIPGSSIKGMIRSMIEIMSFGSMEEKVDDILYSVRDFSNGAKASKLYDPSELSSQSLCGWLRIENGVFYLKPCGRAGRIKHKDLDIISGPLKISQYYQQGGNTSRADQKSARAKYLQFSFKKNGLVFGKADEEDDVGIGREKFIVDPAGEYSGTIVFSGQPSKREEPNKGKQYEFIFFDKGYKEVSLGTDKESIITNFYHAYYDHDRNQQGDDWKWRKSQLMNGEPIPVFFRLKDDKKDLSSANIKDMGLSLLYKITYKHSVRELIRKTQGEKRKKDFAETLFGYATKTDALKGRINISHAFAKGTPKVLTLQKEVLAGPKATYYPTYIDQNSPDGKVTGNYMTMMDAKAKIRGYKRYPVRHGEVNHNPAPINEKTGKPNDEITTQFKPLDKGTQFSFKINYHNLRPEELGALVSALTFHLNDGFYHSIGMGKPLGYGKVKLEVINQSIEELLPSVKSFEAFMNWSLNNSTPSWHKSPQIKELIAMAKPQVQTDKELKYMQMDMKNNDFVNAKGRKKGDPKFGLPTYSTLSGEISFVNHLGDSELYEFKALLEKEEMQFEVLEEINPKDLYEQLLYRERNHVATKIEQLKIKLIQQLEDKKKALKHEKTAQVLEHQEQEKERENKNRIDSGPDYSEVKIGPRAFDPFAKLVSQYIKLIHGVDPKNLGLEHIPYMKDKSAIDKTYHKLVEIASQLPKKDKENWLKEPRLTNKTYEKIASWIGEEKTNELFDNLRNS